MIEKIEKLKNEIEEKEKVLNNIETDVIKLEKDRLAKCVEIAKSGLKFLKIYKERITYNNWQYNKSSKVTYFTNSEGKYLKGLNICTESISKNENACGGEFEKKHLYLMEDGTFKVFYEEGEWSNIQDDKDIYSKTIANDQDISCFDYNEIIESIYEKLESRIEKLDEITTRETTRLEKLKELQIS